MHENHQDPELCYGYQRMTKNLQQCGFIVNHKKIRRLMEAECMLLPKHKKTVKNYVKYRTVQPTIPLEILEMDIKYVWIERETENTLMYSR